MLRFKTLYRKLTPTQARDAERYRALRRKHVEEHPRMLPESYDAFVDGLIAQQKAEDREFPAG